MGWELRNSHWYFYTKTRHGDHVVSHYVGAGDLARLIAQSEYILQAERAELIDDRRRERDQDCDLEQLIERQHQRVMALARAHLLINGCHTHKGQWRKARE